MLAPTLDYRAPLRRVGRSIVPRQLIAFAVAFALGCAALNAIDIFGLGDSNTYIGAEGCYAFDLAFIVVAATIATLLLMATNWLRFKAGLHRQRWRSHFWVCAVGVLLSVFVGGPLLLDTALTGNGYEIHGDGNLIKSGRGSLASEIVFLILPIVLAWVLVRPSLVHDSSKRTDDGVASIIPP